MKTECLWINFRHIDDSYSGCKFFRMSVVFSLTSHLLFAHCPFLLKNAGEDVDTLHQDWRTYKLAVPTYGVILLDPTLSYALLVQGFSKTWGFPKGKINELEDPLKCAIREVSLT